MIIIDKPKLRFLLAGRTLTITVPPRAKQYRPHRPYAIGLNHRTTVCHAEILHTTTTPDGLQLQIRQVTLDRPHLLAAQSEYGYTTNPHQALPDEPEAVHGKELDRLAKEGRDRDEINQLMRQGQTPLPDRVRALEHAAHNGDQQAQRHLFVIKQRVQAAERKRSRDQAA